MQEQSGALTLINEVNPVALYSGGIDDLLYKIANEAKARLLDVSTEEGRDEIRSLAYKIARSKTLLDDMGKQLGEEARAKLNAINADRAKVVKTLDALKDEVRQPLTDYENAAKQRIASFEGHIAEIVQSGAYVSDNWQTLPLDHMRQRIADVTTGHGVTDWAEFAPRATAAVTEATDKINQAIARREKHDAEQAELARLRAAEVERQQRERDERIAKEAADKARCEAEERAADEQRRIEAAKLAAERREQAARDAAAKALADAEAVKQKAAQEALHAAERAEREKQDAVRRERECIEAEQRAEADATAKREADRAHRSKVNNAALAALVKAGLPDDLAKLAVQAIAKGEVPNLKILY